jgi:hypothetical protein
MLKTRGFKVHMRRGGQYLLGPTGMVLFCMLLNCPRRTAAVNGSRNFSGTWL